MPATATAENITVDVQRLGWGVGILVSWSQPSGHHGSFRFAPSIAELTGLLSVRDVALFLRDGFALMSASETACAWYPPGFLAPLADIDWPSVAMRVARALGEPPPLRWDPQADPDVWPEWKPLATAA